MSTIAPVRYGLSVDKALPDGRAEIKKGPWTPSWLEGEGEKARPARKVKMRVKVLPE